MSEQNQPQPVEDAKTERIRILKAQINELRKSLPKHSVPAAMLVQLEDLEEELDQLDIN